MKKAVSILLIAILFFNWYGYRIVADVWAKNADEQLEVKLNGDDYADDQLIELKVPLNIPYQNEQAGFERHYGKIEIDGKLYTYVKRKIEHGYLLLKCIPNTTRQQLTSAGNEYFKWANGLAQTGKRTNKNFEKNFWSEYEGHENGYEYLRFTCPAAATFIHSNLFYSNCCSGVLTQPPDLTL